MLEDSLQMRHGGVVWHISTAPIVYECGFVFGTPDNPEPCCHSILMTVNAKVVMRKPRWGLATIHTEIAPPHVAYTVL